MSLESATTMVSTHRSLLTERCERDLARSPPPCCSLSHSSLSLSTWTESRGASTAWMMGEITGSTLVTYPFLTQKNTHMCTISQTSAQTHTHILIHTLNSTWAGRFFGPNIPFVSVTLCESRIDNVGLWSLGRIIGRFLGRFNKMVSLWQGEEASLQDEHALSRNGWSLVIHFLLNHFLCLETLRHINPSGVLLSQNCNRD